MTMSRKRPFLSEILAGEPIPAGRLAYFRARFKDRLYDLVVSEFMQRQKSEGLKKADVARRLGKDPATITRWLGTPGNWTLETVSDLMLAICQAEPETRIAPLSNRPARNDDGNNWQLQFGLESHARTETRKDQIMTLNAA